MRLQNSQSKVTRWRAAQRPLVLFACLLSASALVGGLTQELLAPHTQLMVPLWASMKQQLSCAAKQLTLNAAGAGVPSLPWMLNEPGRTCLLCLPQH